MQTPFDDLLARLWILFNKGGQRTTQDTNDAKAVFDQLGQVLRNTTNRLEKSERRLRTLVEAIPIGLLVTSQTGKIEVTNKGALALLECSIEEIVGKQLTEIFIANSGGELVCEDKNAPPKKATVNGKLQVELVIRSFDDETGARWVVLFQDVSARHELERMKEEFVSMLTHDLRTPLTSIQAYVGMIADGIYDRDPDAMKLRAAAVDEDAERLIGIISTLLDVYKLESGRLKMFFDVVPCATIIRRSIQSVSSVAQAQGVELSVQPTGNMIHVKADEEYIVQTLINFLSNAIKFSPQGETVVVGTQVGDETVRFTVLDKGPGIDEELKLRLFNRFEQADDRSKEGSGLGLAFARAIVEQHGGTIGVDSEGFGGSTFWFDLPRVQI